MEARVLSTEHSYGVMFNQHVVGGHSGPGWLNEDQVREPAFLLMGFEGGRAAPLPLPRALLPISTPVGKGHHPVVTLK